MSCPEWHNDYFGDCVGCVIDTAKTQERKRIIKLLDTDFWHHKVWDPENPYCVKDCPMCELLIEIRGENETTKHI